MKYFSMLALPALVFAFMFALASSAHASSYYYGGQVSTPYWCGSYYSSYPCPSYTQPYTQQYPYNYNYNNYNYQYATYPYQQSGYWTYCYQTWAPNYGPSYRYPCYQQYGKANTYNYSYPYNYGYQYPYYNY